METLAVAAKAKKKINKRRNAHSAKQFRTPMDGYFCWHRVSSSKVPIKRATTKKKKKLQAAADPFRAA